MIEIVWEFVVKEEARGQFELVSGPGGAWSKLFAPSPGYRGTTLLRDTNNHLRFLTIDFWETEAQHEQILAERAEEYASLHADLGGLTESKTEVGVFRVLAEGTVRPRGKAQRNKAGEIRRRGRRTTR